MELVFAYLDELIEIWLDERDISEKPKITIILVNNPARKTNRQTDF